MNRRDFLLGASAAAGGTAAVSGAASAQAGGGTQTVKVGPGGQLVFEPEELTVSPGSKVKFVWESGGHNVVAEKGDWGHEPLEDSGFSYTTPPFKQKGSLSYHCAPHESAGMVGSITVGQSSSGGGSSGPTVPDSAKTLGIAAMSFMMSTLGLAYFFMRYGGDFETGSDE